MSAQLFLDPDEMSKFYQEKTKKCREILNNPERLKDPELRNNPEKLKQITEEIKNCMRNTMLAIYPGNKSLFRNSYIFKDKNKKYLKKFDAFILSISFDQDMSEDERKTQIRETIEKCIKNYFKDLKNVSMYEELKKFNVGLYGIFDVLLTDFTNKLKERYRYDTKYYKQFLNNPDFNKYRNIIKEIIVDKKNHKKKTIIDCLRFCLRTLFLTAFETYSSENPNEMINYEHIPNIFSIKREMFYLDYVFLNENLDLPHSSDDYKKFLKISNSKAYYQKDTVYEIFYKNNLNKTALTKKQIFEKEKKYIDQKIDEYITNISNTDLKNIYLHLKFFIFDLHHQHKWLYNFIFDDNVFNEEQKKAKQKAKAKQKKKKKKKKKAKESEEQLIQLIQKEEAREAETNKMSTANKHSSSSDDDTRIMLFKDLEGSGILQKYKKAQTDLERQQEKLEQLQIEKGHEQYEQMLLLKKEKKKQFAELQQDFRKQGKTFYQDQSGNYIYIHEPNSINKQQQEFLNKFPVELPKHCFEEHRQIIHLVRQYKLLEEEAYTVFDNIRFYLSHHNPRKGSKKKPYDCNSRKKAIEQYIQAINIRGKAINMLLKSNCNDRGHVAAHYINSQYVVPYKNFYNEIGCQNDYPLVGTIHPLEF